MRPDAFRSAIELSPQDPTLRLNRGKMHYAARRMTWL
jgi:hypothetical protein